MEAAHPTGFGANDDAPLSSRFDTEVGYGMGLFGGRITGTPNVEFGFSDTAREVRLGWRMNAAADAGAEYRIRLRGTTCW